MCIDIDIDIDIDIYTYGTDGLDVQLLQAL
jgi:hypothetical protein